MIVAEMRLSVKPPVSYMCRSSHGRPKRAARESIAASASCRKPAGYNQVTMLERTLVSSCRPKRVLSLFGCIDGSNRSVGPPVYRSFYCEHMCLRYDCFRLGAVVCGEEEGCAMSLNTYNLSAGLFVRGLTNLKTQLTKAEDHAAASGSGEAALLNARIATDGVTSGAPADVHSYTLAAQVHWA